MSQNNSNEKQESMELIKKIKEVPGFNPELFLEEYTDLKTGETRPYLPVLIRMAWCRMLYPESKFAVSVTPIKNGFSATARVYLNYKDPVDCYVSEASASRTYNAENTGSPLREWAQTAALGVALRNAGFGLQFSLAGDEFNSPGSTEFADDQNLSVGTESSSDTDGTESEEYVVEDALPAKELTLEERYEAALKVICPISKFGGKTLNEVLMMDPGAIKWLADKYTGNDEIKAAANTILEYSVQTTQTA